MDDLKQVKPQYISNVAVDYWRKKPILKEPSYAIMALSPTENERIDHQPGEPSVEDKLYPKYVNQTDAMVTSAAVMALSPEQEEPFRDLQMLLGLTLRKGIRSNPNESFGLASKVGCNVKPNFRKTIKRYERRMHSRQADRRQASGCRLQAAGSRRRAVGSRRQVVDGRQRATGGKQQAAGGRRQAAGGGWQVVGGRRRVVKRTTRGDNKISSPLTIDKFLFPIVFIPLSHCVVWRFCFRF